MGPAWSTKSTPASSASLSLGYSAPLERLMPLPGGRAVRYAARRGHLRRGGGEKSYCASNGLLTHS